jgi:hypothetical protein
MAADLFAVKARVPFDFAVAGVQLPAGTYHVGHHGPQGVLAIRDAAGIVKATFQTNALYTNSRTRQPSFVFNKYGDRYFLSRVWMGGMNNGQQLRTSKTERELMTFAPAGQVTVAAFYR